MDAQVIIIKIGFALIIGVLAVGVVSGALTRFAPFMLRLPYVWIGLVLLGILVFLAVITRMF